MWTDLEQALYFKKYCKDTIECPFLEIGEDFVNCFDNCIFEKTLCHQEHDEYDDFNKCIDLSNNIILDDRNKKLERICK